MKTDYEIFEVLIDPDEVDSVQKLACGAVRIDMTDGSAVVVPESVYSVIRPDVEKALLKKLQQAADAVIHVFVMLGGAP